MAAFTTPKWLDQTIIINSDIASELLQRLQDGGVNAATEDLGLRSEGDDVSTISIPEGQKDIARKIFREFTASN